MANASGNGVASMKVAYTTSNQTITPPRTGDAGYDLHAAESLVIPSGDRKRVSIGVHLELPPCTVGMIRDRSGLAHFHGITVLGGIIDSSYRGIVSVILYNTGVKPFEINEGDRIAQLVILPMLTPILEIVTGTWEMGESVRAGNGFGSTGVQTSETPI